LLVEKGKDGIDLNKCNNDGNTPLLAALINNNIETAEYLIIKISERKKTTENINNLNIKK